MIIIADVGVEHILHSITLFSVVIAAIGFLFASYELLDRPMLLQELIRVTVSVLTIIIPFALISALFPQSINFGFLNLKYTSTIFVEYGGLIGVFSGLFMPPTEITTSKQSTTPLNASPGSTKKLGFLRDVFVGCVFASLYWGMQTFFLQGSPFYDFFPKLMQELIGFAFVGAVGGGFWHLMYRGSPLPTDKLPLFSLKDFLVGLVFWSGICSMICLLTTSVFAQFHGISLEVSLVIVLGVALIVLVSGLASGFSRFIFWKTRAVSPDFVDTPLLSSPITLRGGFKDSFWRFMHRAPKNSTNASSFSPLQEITAGIIFWFVLWLIIGLAIWLIVSPVFALLTTEPTSLDYNANISLVTLAFLKAVLIGTTVTVLFGCLTIVFSRCIFWYAREHRSSLVISSTLSTPTTSTSKAAGKTEPATTTNPSATNKSPFFFLLDSVILLTSWYEIWFVFDVILVLYFLLRYLNIHLSISVLVLIGVTITVLGGAALRYVFLKMKGVLHSPTGQSPSFSLQDSLLRPLFWPVIWLSIWAAVTMAFLDEPIDTSSFTPNSLQDLHNLQDLPYLREPQLVILGFVITVLTAVLAVTLLKLISWWDNRRRMDLSEQSSSSTQNKPQYRLVETIHRLIVQNTTDASDSFPLFSQRDCLFGLSFWSAAWLLCGIIVNIVLFIAQITIQGNSPLNAFYRVNIPFITSPLIGTLAVALAGAVTGGLSQFIRWWATHFRPKLFGAIGILLTLFGFLLQLVEPTALLSYLPYTRGHSDKVIDVAWSPDGKRIASASADQTVQVWEVVPDGKVFIYTEHFDSVDAVAWSPDSEYIASGGSDKQIEVWNATTGNTVYRFGNNHVPCYALAWSSDGKRIAGTGDDGIVEVWFPTQKGGGSFGIPLGYGEHFGTVLDVAWSPHGNLLAAASDDGKVRVWNVGNYSGEVLYTYPGHSGSVHAIAWSPDGKRIASAGSDNTVQVWDAMTGKNVIVYRAHSATVNDVAWSPDGKYIASASDDGTAQIWDATGGHHILTYRGHFDTVRAVTWSPDSTRIASASDDRTVQVWDAMTGNNIMTYRSSGSG